MRRTVRHVSRSIAAVVTVILGVALVGVRAPAAAPKSRELREAEARRACAAGRVEAGIELLAELLTEFGHPNYIYNQGRCYQQNGKAEQAISRFKEYLRAAQDIGPDERTRAERFIKELEAELSGPTPTAAPPPPGIVPEAAPQPRPSSDQGTLRPSAAEASAPARSNGLRTAAIALGVVAVAGLTTGVVAGLQVRSLENEVETAKPGDLSVLGLTQKNQRAHNFQTLQWVGYGVGTAALAGAAVCLFLDRRASASSSDGGVRVSGSVGPGGQVGLVLSGWLPGELVTTDRR